MKRMVLVVAAFSQIVIGNPAKADEVPLLLRPTSGWMNTKAADRCRAFRTFANGDKQTVFLFEKYEPESGLYWMVAGDAIRRGPKLEVQFGPNVTGFLYETIISFLNNMGGQFGAK